MEQWLESVYSDGSCYFVTPAQPKLGQQVTVRIRMYAHAPVKAVVLKRLVNGIEFVTEMQKERTEHGLQYFAYTFPMTQNRMQYQFYLVCEDVIYFYTQKQITTYVPDMTYDFVLLADYEQPEWVKSAVFYQIFPERFCNGDPSNDVQSGEYTVDGHPAIRMEHWNDTPLEYHEGYCMDFFGGDLKGIQDKIPYLKGLGVTAVYLNPIFAAPSVHKYDCIDYFRVDPHFGGDQALAELSKALHENGMKLILDISINHTGTQHRWFNKDGVYFDKSTGAYNNPDAPERKYYFFKEGTNEYKAWANVPTLPTLNYTSQTLREVVYRAQDSVLRKWLKPPYSIDGWRFDVADVFARNDEIQLAHEVWPEIRKAIKEENPQAYLLAEDWGDCAGYLQGSEWDSPMNYFGCERPIRQFMGLPDEFLQRTPALAAVQYQLTAPELVGRISEHLAKLPWVIAQNQFNLLDSHDVSRFHLYPQSDWERYRGAVLLQFLLVGAPSIYYGDEAEIGGWITSIEGCRLPMPWDKDIEHTKAYRLYHTLAHLKQESDALVNGGMKFIYAQGRVAALARFDEREALIAVVSSDSSEQTVELPLGSIGAVLPPEGKDLFGALLQAEMVNERTAVMTIPAKKAYLLRCPLR